eukprot:s1774_g9.t1
MLEPRRDLIRARYSPLERPGAFFLELHWPSESSLLWYGMVSLSLFDVPEGLVAEDTEHLQAQLSSGDSCAHVNLIPAITPSTAHAAPTSWDDVRDFSKPSGPSRDPGPSLGFDFSQRGPHGRKAVDAFAIFRIKVYFAITRGSCSSKLGRRGRWCLQDPYLCKSLPQADRQETLTWMAQAFEVMSFPDTLLFDTAMLLDRYYASLPKEDFNTAESQRRLLAAVCVALKTGSNVEPQLPLRQVVAHLGHDEVPFDDVIAAELIILRKLRFDVGTPTSRDFLEALGARLSSFQAPDRAEHLADFLLQLSLADAGLHYRHVVLLCLCVAYALLLQAILEDLELHFPEAAHLEELGFFLGHSPKAADQHTTLANCGRDLQSLWLMTFANQENMYLNHIRLKFSRANYRSVSTLRPPGAPIAIVPSKAPGMSGVGQPEDSTRDGFTD